MYLKNNLLLLMALCFSLVLSAQAYEFSTICDNKATPVVSQDQTGTCWSYSTSSFLESEIIRLTGKEVKLSEMYTVRNTYPAKAWNYLMRQGKAQFSEGGLAHDVINSVATAGLVPESAFLGRDSKAAPHNHAELVAVLKGVLDVYIKRPAGEISPRWKSVVEGVLDIYLGKNPETFTYEGKRYTPQRFLEMTQLNPGDYLSLTSFTHRPYYSIFVLNIPDNFSNGSFYNLPLDELMAVLDYALKNGFTVELDCDVSESTFSGSKGLAVVPARASDARKIMSSICPEKQVDAAFRQQEFENQNSTDDHLMHITGMLKDQKGTIYYKVKNSWGSGNGQDGYVYMSAAYMRLKTISILLHKDGIPKATKKQLKLN